MAVTALKPTHDRVYPDYKFRELLQAIGTDQEIVDGIKTYGYAPPAVSSLKGWRSRNSIPSKWLPLLMYMAMRDGVLRDVQSLMRGPFA